jgi:hypothetical protein
MAVSSIYSRDVYKVEDVIEIDNKLIINNGKIKTY